MMASALRSYADFLASVRFTSAYCSWQCCYYTWFRHLQGRANIPKHAVITQLNGKATPDVETFARVLRALPHGSRAPMEYYTFSERHRRKNVILHVDRQW